MDGYQIGPVLYIQEGASVALLHLELRNGSVGVLNYGTTVIAYSTIYGNQSGGIYNAGSLYITNSTLSRNHAGYDSGGNGGGIYNEGSLDITNSFVSENFAGDSDCCAPGGQGGGIYNAGSLYITNSTLSGNGAGSSITWGDGVHNGYGGDGGGIYNAGSLYITNSTLSGNEAGSSKCLLGKGEERPCGFGGNGGGIFNVGTLTLDNSTVTNNFSGSGVSPGSAGGIYNENSVSMFKNSIIAGNSESDCGGATITSLGNNLVQSIAECYINGDFIHGAAYLRPLQDNGGPTLTHALSRISPAINAGECTNSMGITVTVDQRGEQRPQGEGCDIGAYESPYTSTFEIRDTSLPLIRR